jgi:hypothetical protein
MKTSYESFTEAFVPMQLQVRGVLGEHNDVFPIQYGPYYAYAGELWKLKNTATGDVIVAVAQIITDKWESRGCKNSALIQIALDVFTIAVSAR